MFQDKLRISHRLDETSSIKGNKILDSSADPLCLFVIPGSCDFVVWFPLIHLQSKPRRNTNTKPIHTKAARRMSQVCYCRLDGFPLLLTLPITRLKPGCE